MNYYIDIRLLGDTEVSLGFIWQKIYTEMHLALVKHKDSEHMSKIGFAFPHYMENFPLGDLLRLFTLTKEELELFNIKEKLEKFSDYVIISEIKEVPAKIKGYVTFSRRQVKSSPERLARRYAKRHNKTQEEALIIYDNVIGKETKLPFVIIKSTSSNQQMKIFIEKRIRDAEEKGLFSTYGLSKTSTLPCF